MHLADQDSGPLIAEHLALIRHFGRAQARCSVLVREQQVEIGRLQAQAMRLRAALMLRDTAAAWQQPLPAEADDIAGLEASLVAADLVICQTGCLSHGAYWRVQDHCKRTGKACIEVEKPDALRIVRIHGKQPETEGARP